MRQEQVDTWRRRAMASGVGCASVYWPASAWAHPPHIAPHIWALLLLGVPLVLGLLYTGCTALLLWCLKERLYPDGQPWWRGLAAIYLLSSAGVLVGFLVSLALVLLLGWLGILLDHTFVLMGAITLTTPLIWIAAWLVWRLRARK
jgi:hypothetical protein